MSYKTTLALFAACYIRSSVAQVGDFCAGVTASNCGSNLADGTNFRSFDLSPLCLNDGTFYFDDDGIDHQFAVNVCGKLADECQIQQYCQTPSDAPPTGLDGAICLTDVGAQSEGMVKQFGFSEGCEFDGVPSITPKCSKCSMMAKEVEASGAVEWGQIEENGVKLDYSKGVQATFPVVAMSTVQNAHAFGKCASPQTGFQSVMIFECDCDQASFLNKDVFDDGNTLGVKLGKLGNLGEGVVGGKVPDIYDCMFTMKFKHRDACYAGYCENGGGSSSSGGISGGKKFLIVLCVFGGLYLAAACFCGIKRNKETGETGENRFCPTISLGTYAMFQFITCQTGSMGGGAIPGQSDYNSQRSGSSNSTSYKNQQDLTQL